MRNLVKTPLTAVLFAALLHFAVAWLPFSQTYREAAAQRTVLVAEYGLLLVYGLCVSLAVAVAVGFSRYTGVRAVLPAGGALLVSTGLLPYVMPLVTARPDMVPARSDIFWLAIAVCVCCVLFLFVAAWLFPPVQLQPITPQDVMQQLKKQKGKRKLTKRVVKEEMQKAAKQAEKISKALKMARAKYKIRVPNLLAKLILLSLLYCVLAFLAWYFLSWRLETVRAFYGGPADYPSLNNALVDLLLNNARVVPVALATGLCYALCMVPLLQPLADKRAVFVVATILFYMSGAAGLLAPDTLLPGAVRTARAAEHAVVLLLYGAVAGILLHTSLLRVQPELKRRPRPRPVPVMPVTEVPDVGVEPAALVHAGEEQTAAEEQSEEEPVPETVADTQGEATQPVAQ